METKISGYLVKLTDVKENDVLLRVLTSDGVINILAKGVKKFSAKNRAICQINVMAEWEVSQRTQNDLNVLKTGQIINYNIELNSDLTAISILAFCSDVICRHFSCEHLYQEYQDLYNSFINGSNYYFDFAWLVAAWIKISGVSPQVDCCYNCLNKEVIGLSLDGGFICNTCFKDYDLRYTVEQLKLIRYLFKANYENKASLKELAYNWQIVELLVNYYLYHQPTNFKSWKFLQDLAIIS